jgi:hypothetical protein
VSRRERLSPAPSSEEAVLVAERLSALLERRRAESSSTTAGTSATVIGARHSGRLLGNLLLARAYLVETELEYALRRQAETGGALGEILVELGLITERDLVELLAEQLRMELVDPARIKGDPALLARVPREDARRRAAVPWRRADGHVDVVMADPTDDDAVGKLMTALGEPLRLYLATRADIERAVERLYGRSDA